VRPKAHPSYGVYLTPYCDDCTGANLCFECRKCSETITYIELNGTREQYNRMHELFINDADEYIRRASNRAPAPFLNALTAIYDHDEQAHLGAELGALN